VQQLLAEGCSRAEVSRRLGPAGNPDGAQPLRRYLRPFRAAEHVRTFAEMMRKLRGAQPPQWIVNVMAGDLPGLRTFANGLQRDLAAVTAGLTLPWSSGAVEGQVDRIKMLSSPG
jgi:transposase